MWTSKIRTHTHPFNICTQNSISMNTSERLNRHISRFIKLLLTSRYRKIRHLPLNNFKKNISICTKSKTSCQIHNKTTESITDRDRLWNNFFGCLQFYSYKSENGEYKRELFSPSCHCQSWASIGRLLLVVGLGLRLGPFPGEEDWQANSCFPR